MSKNPSLQDVLARELDSGTMDEGGVGDGWRDPGLALVLVGRYRDRNSYNQWSKVQ